MYLLRFCLIIVIPNLSISMLPIYKTPHISIYKLGESNELLNHYLVSTLETRDICNDPLICGVTYTRKLQSACLRILQTYPEYNSNSFYELNATVVCPYKSGLPFDMRDLLANAFNWNNIIIYFCEWNEKKDCSDSNQELSSEIIPAQTQIFWGDVFVRNQQLKQIMDKLLFRISIQKTSIEHILIICFGSCETHKLIHEYAYRIQQINSSFTGIDLFFLEGCFNIHKDDNSSDEYKNTQSRYEAHMTPEFIHSQYDMPFYPLEQCVLYNSVARAYDIPHYISKVIEYWESIRTKASQGVSFESLLKNHFPGLDASKYGKQNLLSLAEQHITKLKRVLIPPVINPE